jgi:predicted CxxxxCH...CXXCH cytochrome family protein
VATSPAAQPHANDAKASPGATTGFTYCQVCHGTGTDFAGGTSGVSCYPCHVPTSNSPHSSQWRTGDIYVHTTTAEGNASACGFCHLNGANSPIAAPSPPAPAGTAAGCFNNTLCHNGGAGGVPHAVPYNDPAHFGVTAATFPAGCGACHDISAPTTKVGPVCRTCHAAASPLAAANCTSCHASPPNGGTGAAYANIAGAHSVHLGLNGTGSPVSCNTCHNALGPSLLDNNHYNRAKSRVEPGDVAFLTTYNAESGTSSFNSAAFSCSNVSCHGGVARSGGNPGTPLNWRTGTLTVNTACTSCHDSGTAQFNSYNSGEHQFHVVGEGLSCTDCHNTTTLAVNHFTNLGTTAMEGPASATIGGGTTSISAGNYNGISCDPQCHRRRNW